MKPLKTASCTWNQQSFTSRVSFAIRRKYNEQHIFHCIRKCLHRDFEAMLGKGTRQNCAQSIALLLESQLPKFFPFKVILAEPGAPGSWPPVAFRHSWLF